MNPSERNLENLLKRRPLVIRTDPQNQRPPPPRGPQTEHRSRRRRAMPRNSPPPSPPPPLPVDFLYQTPPPRQMSITTRSHDRPPPPEDPVTRRIQALATLATIPAQIIKTPTVKHTPPSPPPRKNRRFERGTPQRVPPETKLKISAHGIFVTDDKKEYIIGEVEDEASFVVSKCIYCKQGIANYSELFAHSELVHGVKVSKSNPNVTVVTEKAKEEKKTTR